MKAACLALCLFLFSPAVTAQSQQRGLSFTLQGGGGLSFALILNDRVDEGISTSGVEFRGQLEGSLHGLLPDSGLRVSLTGSDILLPGTANVAGMGVLFQYVHFFSLFERTFCVGAGMGPTYALAPTKDAGSTWWALTAKADFRTEISGFSVGLFVSFQQLFMPQVEDPLFVTFGVEVLYSLFGRPPIREEHHSVPPVIKHTPQKTVVRDPHDADGDGVPNLKDRCPTTRKGTRVEPNGCRPIADGMVFADLKFLPGKSSFHPGAKLEFLRLVEILKANESIIVVISVVAPNAMLAKKRADIIEMILKQSKIPGERIKTAPQVGRGESVSFDFRLGL
ncbi:hypothetical protein KJ865_05095 [Myxococcota bacterium]|nr:hypothetical protein [Myxococcota bacterium]